MNSAPKGSATSGEQLDEGGTHWRGDPLWRLREVASGSG